MQSTFGKDKTAIVKGLAVLLLLIYHLFENEQLVTSLQVNYGAVSLEDFLMVTRYGNLCVSLFVFVTAYGITTGLLFQGKTDLKVAYQSALRRFGKLMLNFFAMYCSINLLWHKFFDYHGLYGGGIQGGLYALTDALGLTMFFDTPTLNQTWWYMEVAYILIFLVPILAWAIQKVGYSLIAIAFLLPTVLDFNYDMERYLLVTVVGVAAAYGKWFDKLVIYKKCRPLQWVIAIAMVALSVPVRQNYAIQEGYIHVVDAVVVLLWVYLGGVLLSEVPILRNVFAYIGKHSMNIYLVHTFFYMALWQKYIYQFRYAPFIVIVLLLVCLLYSILLEVVKKAAMGVFCWCKAKKNVV